MAEPKENNLNAKLLGVAFAVISILLSVIAYSVVLGIDTQIKHNESSVRADSSFHKLMFNIRVNDIQQSVDIKTNHGLIENVIIEVDEVKENVDQNTKLINKLGGV